MGLHNNYDNLYEHQLKLEGESLNISIKKYYEIFNKGIENLPLGQKIISEALPKLSAAIQEFRESGRGMRGHSLKYMEESKLSSDVLAIITIKCVLKHLTDMEPVGYLCAEIGRYVRAEHESSKFSKEHAGLFYIFTEGLKQKIQPHWKNRRDFNKLKFKVSLTDTHFERRYNVLIGSKLLDLLILTTGLVYKYIAPDNNQFVICTDIVRDWLERNNQTCQYMFPAYFPMVISPKDWSTPYNGGYLGEHNNYRLPIMKCEDKDNLALLKKHDISKVYTGVNHLQRTGWKINKPIYEIIKEIWDGDMKLGGLVKRDMTPLPEPGWAYRDRHTIDKHEILKWKHEQQAVHLENTQNISKRFAINYKLKIAHDFLDYQEIYYPHQLDWRGRVYPIPVLLHPQSDEIARSLLLFSKGKKLGATGLRALKIYGSNLYGVDKVSLDDRVKWVDSHLNEIIDSAVNPLDGGRFWNDADKPFMFLAFCLEMKKIQDEGEQHISYFPVYIDCSQNGYQHISALTLDKESGRKVNLIDSHVPADFYSLIKDMVFEKLQQDVSNNIVHADYWLDKLTRKLIKCVVMIRIYGARRYSFKEKLMSNHKDNNISIEQRLLKTIYLSSLIYNTLEEVIESQNRVNKFLKQIAKVANELDMPISWVSPSGLPVMSDYRKYISQGVNLSSTFHIRKITIPLYVNRNNYKQSNGLTPNYIHSLDSGHMILTVNDFCKDGDKSISTIHDSYGTHACDVDELHKAIRKNFVDIYSQPILKNFKDGIIKQIREHVEDKKIADKHIKKLPELPEFGKLNIYDVLHSKHFCS